MSRAGSPFSYARFAFAEHVCVDCQSFGKREYGATFVVTDKFAPDLAEWIPICDVCETSPRYIEAVKVTMSPFHATSAEREMRLPL
jgi:hypothetical protein